MWRKESASTKGLSSVKEGVKVKDSSRKAASVSNKKEKEKKKQKEDFENGFFIYHFINYLK